MGRVRLERDFTAEDPAAQLADLLDALTRFVDSFVSFPSEEARDTIAPWILQCHAVEAFESTPRLALLSPEKGSGKTRTLEVIEGLVPEPMHAVNLSAAALFRTIQSKGRVTLLLDECDTYLGPRVAKEHEELRGLINAGHRRGAVAYRCVGEPSKMEVREFPAFAPVALAGIGDLPDTILDRAIVIPMRRRAPGEHVADFRRRKVQGPSDKLRERCEKWAKESIDVLRLAEPEMPEGIMDRPADVWESLIAIGDSAGPEWSARIRRSAVVMNEIRQKADPSLGVQLLTDARKIFTEREVDRMFTTDLVTALCELDESPWGDLRGKEIDARGVARRLRPYGIRPKQIRDGESRKGYAIEDFHDAWSRYLPPLDPPGTETTETTETEPEGKEILPEPPGNISTKLSGPPVTPVSDVSHPSGSEAGEAFLDLGERVDAAIGLPLELHEQAAKVRSWNESLPAAPAISEIPWAKQKRDYSR